MGFSAGRAVVTTTVQLSGTLPPPGSAPSNTLPGSTANPTATTKQELTYGLSDGEIDVPLTGEYLIAAGGALTLNLYDGGTTASDLTNLFGGASNLRVVRSLTFAVVSGGDSSGVAIGGAASNEFYGFFAAAGDKVKIYPDGPALALGSPAGAAVTSSAKNVKIENLGAAEVVVRVSAAGASITVGQWTGFWGFVTYS